MKGLFVLFALWSTTALFVNGQPACTQGSSPFSLFLISCTLFLSFEDFNSSFYLALRDFYNSGNGPDWTNNNNWVINHIHSFFLFFLFFSFFLSFFLFGIIGCLPWQTPNNRSPFLLVFLISCFLFCFLRLSCFSSTLYQSNIFIFSDGARGSL